MKRVRPYKLIKNVLNQGLRIIYKNLYIIIYNFYKIIIIYIPKLEKLANTGTGR